MIKFENGLVSLEGPTVALLAELACIVSSLNGSFVSPDSCDFLRRCRPW